MERPDPNEVLSRLKDFQLRTVDYVFDRMYGDNPTYRFLVADEVGLGKTLVARGLIAKAIEHLWDTVDRIDVVYICSNSDIARQNIRRLNVTAEQDFTFEQRLTLLATQLKNLTKNKVNFVAFTPGTSFGVHRSMGRKEERALLWWLLRDTIGKDELSLDRKGDLRIFQGGVTSTDNIKRLIKKAAEDVAAVDPGVRRAFKQAVRTADTAAREQGDLTFEQRWRELRTRFMYNLNDRPREDWDDRRHFMGELRRLLAQAVITALEPDIVILDEFQRFKDLLEGESVAALLAKELFDFSDETAQARTLLLSATPYKMYTLSEESDRDDHYGDFVSTVKFLMNGSTDGFERDLKGMRHALYAIGAGGSAGEALKAKRDVEGALRRVMCRTERLSAAQDRNGMLIEQTTQARVTPEDALAYVELHKLAEALESGSHVEYWKSAPYFPNLMDDYKLGRDFRKALEEDLPRATAARDALAEGHGLIDWERHRAFDELEPGNARLRELLEHTTEAGAWKLLWVPPSLPYTEPGNPYDTIDPSFTKRLIFSAWNAVPRAIATLTSYDAEQRMMKLARRENTPESRAKISELLKFTRSQGRLNGMPVLALVYPSPTLARLADPRAIAAEAGTHPLPQEDLRTTVRNRLEGALATLGLPEPYGRPDESWYWAVPFLLDRQAGEAGWLLDDEATASWPRTAPGRTSAGFQRHVELARSLVDDRLVLGPPPDDLVDVVTELAIGAPATVALRALSRVLGDGSLTDHVVRRGAAQIGFEFRNLFNIPEVRYLINQLLQGKDEPYWQKTLRYSVNGNLQAVLDEYAHVLREWLGILDDATDAARADLAGAMADSVSLRSVDYELRDPMDGWDEGKRRIRSRFALPFGHRREDESGQIQRSSDVRQAFNSPFWPFVLASTSVGQEGLDFHTYCHAVVHWNLPSNPVDLEQREGRVHRYKGHAVRKNVAERHREVAFDGAADPWQAMFNEAEEGRSQADDDLIPYWIYPGSAKIERHIPAVPFSREIPRLASLKRTLALYRLVFGQPRQEDLLEFLLTQGIDDEAAERLVDELKIDLTPR